MLPDALRPVQTEPVIGKTYHIKGTKALVRIIEQTGYDSYTMITANGLCTFDAYEVECFNNGAIRLKIK